MNTVLCYNTIGKGQHGPTAGGCVKTRCEGKCNNSVSVTNACTMATCFKIKKWVDVDRDSGQKKTKTN